MATLSDLNELSDQEAQTEFLRCCGSRRWAEQMAAARPFSGEGELYGAAQRLWEALTPADWLEAFGHHPRIGERSGSQWANQEQAGTQGASKMVLDALAKGNQEYEKKFGFVFLVCATGKTADQMLGLLEARLGNTPEAELHIAAAEQGKITRLRLEKWLRS